MNLDAIHFYHQFQLPDGRRTGGWLDCDAQWERFAPHWPDVAGRSVLDVGAWDGWHSFNAVRMGASRVRATDHFCWSGPGWGTKDGFDAMKRIYGMEAVEEQDIDPADISPATVGEWDVVLLLGVLYHRPDAYQAFANVAGVCRESLVVETVLDDTLPTDRPALVFFPGSELNGDPTNWYAPNVACVRAYYEAAGFQAPTVATWPSGLPGYSRGLFVGRR